MRKNSAQKPVKSMNLSMNACGDLQSFNVSTQTGGKVIAESEILRLIKEEAVIEVAEGIL